MEEVIRFVQAGFSSPWRYLKRMHWRRKFNRMPEEGKKLAVFMKVDPDSLIARGLL
jgi:hypothetical protein